MLLWGAVALCQTVFGPNTELHIHSRESLCVGKFDLQCKKHFQWSLRMSIYYTFNISLFSVPSRLPGTSASAYYVVYAGVTKTIKKTISFIS